MSPLIGFLGTFGHWEILILAGIALLIFGKRVPSVMRSLGSSIVEFKKGINGVEEAEPDKVVRSQETPAETPIM